tara:strand:- start:431 stop:694 length:264 start_codon:yes stop_codon:yes gene_type:complete
MNIKNYSTLKAANKVSFSKTQDSDGNDIIQITEKRFDGATGEEAADVVNVIHLADYETEKSIHESDKKRLEVMIAELDKIITDIKAL